MNALGPGFVAADFNHHRGTASEASAWAVKHALLGAESPSGPFISKEENPETSKVH